MAGTKKEEIESKNALAEVSKAEAKVEEIKAEREAAKAKKHADRIAKHPKLGPKINWIDDNKFKIGAFVLTGGASFAAGWIGKKLFDKKKLENSAAEAVDVTEEGPDEAPFNTEA